MIDHLVFDLDGTLVDSATICTEILNDMLRDRGVSRRIELEVARPFMSHGGLFMIRGLLGEHCRDAEAELNEFRARYAVAATPSNSFFDGVREGLYDLADRGYRLAICSNKPQHLCDKVLSELGVDHLFSAVVGTRPGRRSKPEMDLWVATLEELGAHARQCLFVGDSELDHLVAREAGVPFLLVTWGYADPQWCTAGLTRFDRFADLVTTVGATTGSVQRLSRVA